MNVRRGKERRTGAALHSFIAVVGPSLSPALVESIGESAARSPAPVAVPPSLMPWASRDVGGS